MTNNEGVMAKFFAFTDDNQIYQFKVLLEKNMISCEQLGNNLFRKIHLEPNFKIMTKEMETISCEELNDKLVDGNGLISGIFIAKPLLKYCVDNGMLSYNKETALLFGLDPNYAIENHYVEPNMGKRKVLSRINNNK